jgi:hypothetical protein
LLSLALGGMMKPFPAASARKRLTNWLLWSSDSSRALSLAAIAYVP